jgi:hypothetical protein
MYEFQNAVFLSVAGACGLSAFTAWKSLESVRSRRYKQSRGYAPVPLLLLRLYELTEAPFKCSNQSAARRDQKSHPFALS